MARKTPKNFVPRAPTQTRLILFLFFLIVLLGSRPRLGLNLEGELGNFGLKQFAGNDHGRRNEAILDPQSSAFSRTTVST
jgi:hypothetical protein